MSNERVTLAQELHDGIAQDLVALGFSIDAMVAQCTDRQLKSTLRELRFNLTAVMERVRTQIHFLRAQTEPLATELDSEITYELQRIFLELIRNVQEHSEASKVTIEVGDNGKGGLDVKAGSFGLRGVQERIEKLNGEIHIDSDTEGTRISITIPLER